MLTNGTRQDFDAFFGKVEIGSAHHETGDVLGSGRQAALLYDSPRAAGFDLRGDSGEALVAGRAADILVPHKVDVAVRASAVGEDGSAEVVQDFVDGVAAAASDAEHGREDITL